MKDSCKLQIPPNLLAKAFKKNSINISGKLSGIFHQVFIRVTGSFVKDLSIFQKTFSKGYGKFKGRIRQDFCNVRFLSIFRKIQRNISEIFHEGVLDDHNGLGHYFWESF